MSTRFVDRNIYIYFTAITCSILKSMARILPVTEEEYTPQIREAFENHVRVYQGRITNMKATLAHSLNAFEVYMQWYVLYAEVERILGKKLAPIFAYAVSYATDCPLCSTFFRKIIIDAGGNPEKFDLSETEQLVITFGASIGKCQGHIANHVYDPVARLYSTADVVQLVAFAGQMIATNVFNNTIETDIDDYLCDYLSPVKPNLPHV
jgi:hypothetical protein